MGDCGVVVSFVQKWRARISVLPYIFLMTVTSNLNYPSQQGLIYNRICHQQYPDLFKNESFTCGDLEDSQVNHVKSIAANWNLVLNAVFYIPQLLAVIILGNLSDKVGQKLLLPLPTVLATLANVVYLIESLNSHWPIWPFLLGNLLQGVGGGFGCAFMLSVSYLSRQSNRSSRTAYLSIGEAASNIGTFLGMFLSGPIIDAFNFTVIWVINLILYTITLCYILIIPANPKPEKEMETDVDVSAGTSETEDNFQHTVEPDVNLSYSSINQETSFSCQDVCAISQLVDGFLVCYRHKQRTLTLLLIYTTSLCFLSSVGEAAISYLYTKDDPIDLTQSEYSYYIGGLYCAKIVGSMLVLPFLSKVLNVDDLTCATIGMVSRMAAEIYLSICETKFMIYCVPFIAMLSSMVAPSCRSMLTKITPANEIGALFSIVAFAEILVTVCGSTFFSAIYPCLISWWPGFCFCIIAMVLFTGFCILIGLKVRQKIESSANPVLVSVDDD